MSFFELCGELVPHEYCFAFGEVPGANCFASAVDYFDGCVLVGYDVGVCHGVLLAVELWVVPLACVYSLSVFWVCIKFCIGLFVVFSFCLWCQFLGIISILCFLVVRVKSLFGVFFGLVFCWGVV